MTSRVALIRARLPKNWANAGRMRWCEHLRGSGTFGGRRAKDVKKQIPLLVDKSAKLLLVKNF